MQLRPFATPAWGSQKLRPILDWLSSSVRRPSQNRHLKVCHQKRFNLRSQTTFFFFLNVADNRKLIGQSSSEVRGIHRFYVLILCKSNSGKYRICRKYFTSKCNFHIRNIEIFHRRSQGIGMGCAFPPGYYKSSASASKLTDLCIF